MLLSFAGKLNRAAEKIRVACEGRPYKVRGLRDLIHAHASLGGLSDHEKASGCLLALSDYVALMRSDDETREFLEKLIEGAK